MISTKKLLYKIVNAIDGQNFGTPITIRNASSTSNTFTNAAITFTYIVN